MLKKKVLFSVRMHHDVIADIVDLLRKEDRINFVFHDPLREFFDLAELEQRFGDVDFFIVKIGNDSSIDLLHWVKLNNKPALHDYETVLMCKNKVALDQSLRKMFQDHPHLSEHFALPQSWNNNLREVEKFKKWASDKLPIVVKSHNQHDKYRRFNFLVRDLNEDIDQFCERYSEFLFYDVYIQKFVECDGFDRKIYVMGDQIFGLKRENPIYIFMRDKPDDIDVTKIEREDFEVSEEIKELASIISSDLKLRIYGLDLVKSLDDGRYYLIDINDFPSFRGIENIDEILSTYLVEYSKSQLNK
ncbi:MAG: hypothetical protein GF383_13655 [Candidatus Lokiarchaeota archaeon]|nr:hypothetical protein [Candidatus Lokiarchaeota archaeon]MBD3342300.1 hypothetical protein [Candidatus Lokiarchaeota archaeon]